MATAFDETIRVGDVGAPIEVRFVDKDANAIDVSAAAGYTAISIFVRAPTGRTWTEFAASYVGTGTDGKIEYVTTAVGDIPVAGDWLVQGAATNASGERKTSHGTLTVESAPE